MDLAEPAQIPRINTLLDQHHYLGALRPVGQRLYYLARDAAGEWLAVLIFSAPAKHLKHRDAWIGWSNEQRRRRLSLVTNNSRYLLVPERSVPNLGSRVLRLTLDRLSADWQTHYGHPVEVVETFVDPERYRGTCYFAANWKLLGRATGRGKQSNSYVPNRSIKEVLGYPLTKRFRQLLGE